MKIFFLRLMLPLLIGTTIMAIGYGFASLLRGNLQFFTWPPALQGVVIIFALFATVMSGLMIFGTHSHLSQ